MIDYKKQGKKNRASGADFEKRVRADLEKSCWVVAKWPNNVKDEVCVPVKPKFNPFTKSLMMNSGGFPDFIAYGARAYPENFPDKCPLLFNVVFVECKTNGTLDKKEKESAQWYLDNHYCSKFLIAYKTKEGNRVKINYKTFGRLDGEIDES